MSLGAVKYIVSMKENLRRTTINVWEHPLREEGKTKDEFLAHAKSVSLSHKKGS